MQLKLIDEASLCLLKKGYMVKSVARNCFDILARKGNQILLIKILADANAVSDELVGEMKKIASTLQAAPLVVADKAGSEMLERGVVYSRLGVFTLSLDTLGSCLKQEMPFVVKSNAGFTMLVNGEELKAKREEFGYSLAELSRKIGVSRSMVMKYECGAEMIAARAEKLYGIFGESVFDQVDVFKPFEGLVEVYDSDYVVKYSELGFKAANVQKAPFDIVARKQEEIILTGIGDVVKRSVLDLSELLEADNLVIFKRRKPKDVPACTREEFLEFGEANELVKFLKEF